MLDEYFIKRRGADQMYIHRCYVYVGTLGILIYPLHFSHEDSGTERNLRDSDAKLIYIVRNEDIWSV